MQEDKESAFQETHDSLRHLHSCVCRLERRKLGSERGRKGEKAREGVSSLLRRQRHVDSTIWSLPTLSILLKPCLQLVRASQSRKKMRISTSRCFPLTAHRCSSYIHVNSQTLYDYPQRPPVRLFPFLAVFAFLTSWKCCGRRNEGSRSTPQSIDQWVACLQHTQHLGQLSSPSPATTPPSAGRSLSSSSSTNLKARTSQARPPHSHRHGLHSATPRHDAHRRHYSAVQGRLLRQPRLRRASSPQASIERGCHPRQGA
jgi:hypothetical protein